ncbi:MAG: response regulator [Planctomycetes bacterium]|nr:response regulator [Planctomycetota bacterium]
MASKRETERRSKILVIDDSVADVDLITEILADAGYEVASREDGPSGLEAFQKDRPDLVLLDIIMPRMSGLEVCEKMRKSAAKAFIPIVMLTALSGDEEKVKAMDLGADDFLSKPFYPSELVARVRAHLRTKKLYDELEVSNRKLRILQKVKEGTDRMIAHDLKNHLTSIIGHAQLVLRTKSQVPDKVLVHVDKISNSANELLKAVSRLTEQSRDERMIGES